MLVDFLETAINETLCVTGGTISISTQILEPRLKLSVLRSESYRVAGFQLAQIKQFPLQGWEMLQVGERH